MDKVMDTGICRFCGQLVQIEVDDGASSAEKNLQAVQNCTCFGANRAREKTASIVKAKELVRELFEGEGLPPSEEVAVPPQRSLCEILCDAAELIGAGVIAGITVSVDSRTKAKLSGSAKGRIKVERSDTEKIIREE